MAKKIYLSPSDQKANLYAVGNTNEAEQCRKIALAAKAALERCGFEVKANVTENEYKARVKESNAWKADAHIPIHTNAYNGKVSGFRGFYYKAHDEGHELVSAIMEAVAPITVGTSDGVSAYPGLYEISASDAPCAYLELGFHDNPTEAQYIIDHVDDLGEAICKGICKHYGVQYVAPAAVQKDVFFRVQVGAFNERKNAERQRDELIAKGYTDAFIVEAAR